MFVSRCDNLKTVNVFVMGKLSNEDKMHLHTLCEQGLEAKVIRALSKLFWQKLELEHVAEDLLSGWCVTQVTIGQSLHIVLKGWRVDLLTACKAWYKHKFSPDGKTTQHQCNFGPSNHQTRSPVVSISARPISVQCHKTETNCVFQSSAQTPDYRSNKEGPLCWW